MSNWAALQNRLEQQGQAAIDNYRAAGEDTRKSRAEARAARTISNAPDAVNASYASDEFLPVDPALLTTRAPLRDRQHSMPRAAWSKREREVPEDDGRPLQTYWERRGDAASRRAEAANEANQFLMDLVAERGDRQDDIDLANAMKAVLSQTQRAETRANTKIGENAPAPVKKPRKQLKAKAQKHASALAKQGAIGRAWKGAGFANPLVGQQIYQQGTNENIARYGPDVVQATDQQLLNRAMMNYMGQGRYNGQGGFFDDILTGVKDVGKVLLAPAVGLGATALNSVIPGAGTALAPVAMGLGKKILGTGAYDANGNEIMVEVPQQALNDINSGMKTHQPLTFQDTLAPQPQYGMSRQLGSTILPDGKVVRYSKNLTDMDKVFYNNIVNPGSANSRTVPRITSVNDETGDIIFSHNEYLHDISSLTADFHTTERIEINPGLDKSFPILAGFAKKFQEYRFDQCLFHIKSLVTEGNATAAGSVMLCPSYNPSNADLQDKRSVENSEGAVSDKVTSNIVCGIECAQDKTAYGSLKYVREVDVDPVGRRLYDVGFLQVAMQGVPAGLPVGELWCSYRVVLSKMRVQTIAPTPVGEGFTVVLNSAQSNRTDLVSTPKPYALFGDPLSLPPQILAQNTSETLVITDQGPNTVSPVPGQSNFGSYNFNTPIIGGSEFEFAVQIPVTVTFGSNPGTTFNVNDAVKYVLSQLSQGGMQLNIPFNCSVGTIPPTVTPSTVTTSFQGYGVIPPGLPWSSWYFSCIMILKQTIVMQLPGQQGNFSGTVTITGDNAWKSESGSLNPGQHGITIAAGMTSSASLIRTK